MHELFLKCNRHKLFASWRHSTAVPDNSDLLSSLIFCVTLTEMESLKHDRRLLKLNKDQADFGQVLLNTKWRRLVAIRI